MFQSPSLRGSGRFTRNPGPTPGRCRVSIPFIAGQWSLPLPRRGEGDPFAYRFNPLHCGAVVASSTPEARRGTRRSFNPLHCGAVVASRISVWVATHRRPVSIPFIAGQWSLLFAHLLIGRPPTRVSIPFIAGQWSLLGAALRVRDGAPCFNPLHCGAVVASSSRPGRRPPRTSFNPLHCGAVVASHRAAARKEAEVRVSIPFIAGQWSLHLPPSCGDRAGREFQSPSLRGSGRFSAVWRAPKRIGTCFNPLHCGAVVASRLEVGRAARTGPRFNPLHCGAVVASSRSRTAPPHGGVFQSPSLRGSGRFSPSCRSARA